MKPSVYVLQASIGCCMLIARAQAFSTRPIYGISTRLFRGCSRWGKKLGDGSSTISGSITSSSYSSLYSSPAESDDPSSSSSSSTTTTSFMFPNLSVAIVGAGPAGLLLAHALLQANLCGEISLYESRPRPTLQQPGTRAYALGIGRRGRTAIRSIGNTLDVDPPASPTNNNDTNHPPASTMSSSSSLWDRVTTVGNTCERFQLKLGSRLSIPLRTERDSRSHQKGNDNDPTAIEPSLLLFQTDLCRAMLEELEVKALDLATMAAAASNTTMAPHQATKVQMYFDTRVSEINLQSMTLTVESDAVAPMVPNDDDDDDRDRSGKKQVTVPFDLIIGADGVNSRVRQAMDDLSTLHSPSQPLASPLLNAVVTALPGVYKAVRLPQMPPKLDPLSVALLLPSSGSSTAFVTPTFNNTACVLFAGRNTTDPLFQSTPASSTTPSTISLLADSIQSRFPLLDGIQDTVAAQLVQATVASASSVQCQTFHVGGRAVLIGDAAHATGGVSGQGLNSALQDSIVLVDCLRAAFSSRTHSPVVPHSRLLSSDSDSRDSNNNHQNHLLYEQVLGNALLEYSKRQVPEGQALYDLSFPKPSTNPWQKFISGVKTARDFIFQGRFGIGDLPLQTKLTTSLDSFADIRRQRGSSKDDDDFPSQESFDQRLEQLHQESQRYFMSSSSTNDDTSSSSSSSSSSEAQESSSVT